jgi:hypothetical protein
VIDEFVKNLQGSELFAIDSANISQIVTLRQTADAEHWAFPYTIKLLLKTPIALP